MIPAPFKMKTVGSILKSERERKNWSIEEISKFLKIHPKYLKALEEGRYEIFADSVHIKGFLKNYVGFLGLNESEVLAFFRREYNEEFKKGDLKFSKNSLLSPKIVFTPGILVSISIALLVVIFFFYLLYQYRSFASAPELRILNPPEDIVISENVINVYGSTDRDSQVLINGQRVDISEEGKFATTISLPEGVNNLNFLSTNKLGRQSRVTRTIVVEKVKEVLDPEATESAKIAGDLTLEVQVSPNASWMRVEVDNDIKFDGVVLSGAQKLFKGSNSIKIKVGNAGSVKLIVNGKDLGILGPEGEVVEREFKVEESF